MSDKVYWDLTRMQMAGVQPSILAIGDSWFWYPFPGGSLINKVADFLNEDHHIYAIGNNGARACDYVHGRYAKTVRHTLKTYGGSLSAVFISGGGNDFAGISDLRPLLKDNCSAEASAPACFRKRHRQPPHTRKQGLGQRDPSHPQRVRPHRPAALEAGPGRARHDLTAGVVPNSVRAAAARVDTCPSTRLI